MILGALFDFNGTLLDDSKKHILAFQRIFAIKGMPYLDAETIAERTFGKTNRDIFRMFCGDDLTISELDSMGYEKEAIYRDICLESPETFKLADGVLEMFDWLKEREIPFNIATGSGIENVEFYYEHLELGKWLPIETIVYNDNTLRGKPAPDFYVEAAHRIGLEVSECIVFEDALSGFVSARAAGAGAIYGLLSSDGAPLLTGDVVIDGEIRDFSSFEEIFKKHGLI